MIAQLAISSNGLSVVYGDMVGFDGNEFYFYSQNKVGQMVILLKKVLTDLITVLQWEFILKRKNHSKPSKRYGCKNKDELIVFAEDDSTINILTILFMNQKLIQFQQ